jgi:antitoxin MazE
MRTSIQKWGNSLAVRIPKSFANEAGLEKEAAVELSLVDGQLVITPVAKPKPTIKHLLAGVTKDNLHREIETGAATGKETW